MVASRLQRWAILLSAYTYDIEYKPTQEHGNADMLPRLPVGPDTTFDTTSLSTVMNIIQDEQMKHSPVVATDVQKADKDDRILTQVTNYMLNGWPRVKTSQQRTTTILTLTVNMSS